MIMMMMMMISVAGTGTAAGNGQRAAYLQLHWLTVVSHKLRPNTFEAV